MTESKFSNLDLFNLLNSTTLKNQVCHVCGTIHILCRLIPNNPTLPEKKTKDKIKKKQTNKKQQKKQQKTNYRNNKNLTPTAVRQVTHYRTVQSKRTFLFPKGLKMMNKKARQHSPNILSTVLLGEIEELLFRLLYSWTYVCCKEKFLYLASLVESTKQK